MSAPVGDADPFGTTTDADAYVPRPACERALGELIRELHAGRKLLALTGPTGIGKTQLLRVLAVRLEGEADVLILPYAGLGFDDLCRWSLGLLGEPLARGSEIEPSEALLAAAQRRAAEGRILVLALDDASGLPPASARLLTRLVSEADGALRLVVVPVDDPRAGRVLAALGRGVCEVRLNAPMTEDETAAYIAGRLALQPPPPEIARRFDEGAVGWLHRASGGFPRELHHLAFRIQRGLADPAGDPFARREQWLEVEGEDALDEPADERVEPVEPVEVPTVIEVLPATARGVETGAVAPPERLAPVAPEIGVHHEAAVDGAPPRGAFPDVRSAGPAAIRAAGSRTGGGLRWIGFAFLVSLPLLAALWLLSRPSAPPPELAPAAPPVADVDVPTAPEAGPEDTAGLEPAVPAVEVAERALPEDDALELVNAAQNPGTRVPADVAVPAIPGSPEAATLEPEPQAGPPAALAPEPQPGPPAALAPEPQPGPPAALDDAPLAAAVRVPVNLNARPWATVWIDGIERGTTPLAGVPLEEGVHHFRLVFPDGHVREAERRVDGENRHFSFGL